MTQEILELTSGGEGLDTHDGDLVNWPRKVVVGLVVEAQGQPTLLLQIGLVNSKDWIIVVSRINTSRSVSVPGK